MGNDHPKNISSSSRNSSTRGDGAIVVVDALFSINGEGGLVLRVLVPVLVLLLLIVNLIARMYFLYYIHLMTEYDVP